MFIDFSSFICYIIYRFQGGLDLFFNVVVDSYVVACGLDDKQLAFAVARQWADCFPLSEVKVIEIQSYRGFFNA